MDATTVGSPFHDSVLPIVGLLGGVWCAWRYWKVAHAHATRRNEGWAKFPHLFGATFGGLAFVFWYVVLIITVYPTHWGRLWLLWCFAVVTMVVAWRWLNTIKRYSPAMGIETPAPRPAATDAPAPAVQMKVDVPSPRKAFVPTPAQLAQIEQARQSSLATLKAKGQGRKLPAKLAITQATPPAVVEPRKQAAKPTVQDIEPIDLPDRVEINYLKSDGGLDRRIVNVNQVDRFGDKFTGFCERAGAVRTFKASGIQGKVTRLETGEMVDHRAWFNALKGKSTPSPKPAQRERKSAVALLGFHYSKYEALAEQVEAAGWHARHALSDSVDYVVFGPNAGDRQRKDADKRAITELSESQLKKMI